MKLVNAFIKALLGLVFVLVSKVESNNALDELPEKELEEALKVLEGFMAGMFDPGDENDLGRATLADKTAYYPCNTVIQTLTVEDFIEDAKAVVSNEWKGYDVPFTGQILMALDRLLSATMKYDIQVWKVCGRCSDFSPVVGVACEEHEYGYNATHSGLLIAPYNTAEGRIYESTLPVNVISAAGGAVPSEQWIIPLGHPIVILGAIYSSVSKSYTVMPDNIGMGESAKDFYRAFLNRQSLATAVAPVLWQAESIVSQETNCASALGDAVVVSGYSEGGYGAVVVADTLASMGKTIVALHAGGGTYRLSSATMLPAIKKVRAGNRHMTFYMTVLGAGLSSTTTDARNFGKGQDFIVPDWRNILLAEVQRTRRAQQKLKNLLPYDDPMSVFNQDMLAVYETGMANGEAEPCVTSVTNETAALCQALRDQDVHHILESATYPVYLCHSKEDQIIPFANLPDMNANPTWLNLKIVSGEHEPAGGPCIIDTIVYFANGNNVLNLPVVDKTCEDGCGCDLPAAEMATQSDHDPPERCNLLHRIFGFSCNVDEGYSGWGFFDIDFSWFDLDFSF